MQVIRAVVDRELERRTVEHEASVGNPVAVTADHRTEVASLGEVVVERVETEDHILAAAVSIRRAHRDEGRAVRHHRDLQATIVRERETIDRRAVGQTAER